MSGISVEKSTLLTVFYIVRLDYVGGLLPIYVGLAIAGSGTSNAAWQIRQITYDANNNPTAVLFASGTNKFNRKWDDRATYVYS